jgi:hypothetical protein
MCERVKRNRVRCLPGKVGRMPLSSQMSEMIRVKIDEAAREHETDDEMRFLKTVNAFATATFVSAKEEMNFWWSISIPIRRVPCGYVSF